ncbi:MAG: hypothetical protein PWQ23_1671 [Thermoanaerobacter sp.]|nr:hypothetical protein [Thermoanaerobacter sp.]
MESIVIISIVVFSVIILALYTYLIFEKIYVLINNILKQRYMNEISKFLDGLIYLLDEKDVDETDIEKLRVLMRNKIKRNLIEERMAYYFENFKGIVAERLTVLCEKIGLIDYEISNLNKGNMFKVSLACRYLGDYRSKKAVKPLLNLVTTHSLDLLYNVLLALAKIGDEESFVEAFKKLSNKILLSERSIIEIVDNFEGDKLYVYKSLMYLDDDFVASIFIKSAGNYRDTSLADDIAKFLKSNNKEKKIAALKALGSMGDNRFTDEIIELLKDEEWEVRAVTAKVLGQIQDERALVPLVDALSDKQWYVRYNAAHSLININGGLEAIKTVFQKDDNFAKDIVVSVLETDYGYDKLLQYESVFYTDPKLSDLIAEYVKSKLEVMA